jgi:hypothetical protein
VTITTPAAFNGLAYASRLKWYDGSASFRETA